MPLESGTDNVKQRQRSDRHRVIATERALPFESRITDCWISEAVCFDLRREALWADCNARGAELQAATGRN